MPDDDDGPVTSSVHDETPEERAHRLEKEGPERENLIYASIHTLLDTVKDLDQTARSLMDDDASHDRISELLAGLIALQGSAATLETQLVGAGVEDEKVLSAVRQVLGGASVASADAAAAVASSEPVEIRGKLQNVSEQLGFMQVDLQGASN